MRHISHTLIFLTLFLFGCSTIYQQQTVTTIMGGYSDQKLPTGEYQVGFSGNGYLSSAVADDYLLLRCAEVATDNGSKYFEVLLGLGGRYDSTFLTGYDMGYNYPDNANIEYVIKLHNEEPAEAEGKVFDALAIIRIIRKRHGLD